MDTRELQGLGFSCLEGCGFCCTFTPEASAQELTLLRGRFPDLPVVRTGETALLGFQGQCGACTLLSGRRCTAYGQRPAHCRYFPFHVYFGRRTEAYVNRSCPGVVAAPSGTLDAGFRQQVLATVPPFRLQKLQQKATQVHQAFERKARAAGAWGDVDAAARQLLEEPTRWFAPADWPFAAAQPGMAGSPDEALAVALAPFGADDPVARPFHVGPDLRWLAFRGGADGVYVDVLEEGGTLTPTAQLGPVAAWPELPPAVRDALGQTLGRLAGRDVFAGTVFDLVDGAEYQVDVATACAIRLADMAAALALRAELLHRLGRSWDEAGAEAWRAYDSAFLDESTIGGWL